MSKPKSKPVADIIHEAVIDECARLVPTNWCDPLLTGPQKVIDQLPPREIEALLRSVQDRIRALKSISQ